MNREMIEHLPDRIDAIERKLDALASSVDGRFGAIDERFAAIDRRFADVTTQFIEHREYTEFAFERLRTEMVARFELVATREQADRIERKLDAFVDSASTLLAQLRSPRRPGRR